MAHAIKSAALLGIAALAATAIATPGFAATTEIREVASNNLYSGNARATLIQNLVISGGGNTTCTASTLSGTVDSDGNPLSIASATITGCSGTASAVTAQGLPWSSGTVVYSPVVSGRDGVVNLNGFSVRATVLGVNCTYGANIAANGFNGGNANRPVSTNSQAQVNLAGITIPRTAGIFLCPSSATITQGAYQLTGETSPGSGVFTNSLYITGTP